MASCDHNQEETVTERRCPTTRKYTIKQLETSALKFVKILDIDFDRLSKHAVNIYRLRNAEDWNGLHKEQLNTCRTVQQIGVNIKEIEKVRNQVKDEDLKQFDSKLGVVKSRTLSSMEQILTFIGLASDLSLQTSGTGTHNQHLVSFGNGVPSQITQSINPRLQHRSYSQSTESQHRVVYGRQDAAPHTPFGSLPCSLSVAPAPLLIDHLHDFPPDCQALISWEQLQEIIIELNDQVHHFAAKLEHLEDVIGNLEENNDTVKEDGNQEKQQFVKTSNYKSALLPVVGAVVGGVVGGPIGLVAGMKIGGIFGAVGGAVGFASGKLVKAHQEKTSKIEMNTLVDKDAASHSDRREEAETESSQQLSETERCYQSAAKTEQTQPRFDTDVADVFAAVTTSFKRFFSFSEDK